MEIASLTSLPIGVLSWNSPDPSMTIIVKGTFALGRDGPMAFADEQLPLCLDSMGTEPGELYTASDFAPRKQGVDLLLVGHLSRAQPTREFRFALTVDGFYKQWAASSLMPTHSVELTARHVGERLAPAPTSPHGWLSRTVAPGFDFSAFNAALPALRLRELNRDARLVLEGMLSGNTPRAVSLPGVQPCVFYLSDRQGRPDRAQRVSMRADTLWIDIDRAILTVTWRGDVRRAMSTSARPAAVLTLETPAASYQWADVEGQLASAEWVPATHEHELRTMETVPPPTIEGATRKLSSASHSGAVVRESLSDMARRLGSGTEVMDEDTEHRDDEPTHRLHLDVAARTRLATDQVTTSRHPELGRPEVSTTEYTRSEVMPDSDDGMDVTLSPDEPTIPYDPEASRVGPGGVVPLGLYARVRAEASNEPLDAVLARRGIDRQVWEANERRQAVAVARDASDGGTLGTQIEAAIQAAKLELRRG